MIHNYPENILMRIREHECMNYHDTSRDEEFQQMSPVDVLDIVLGWEGIINYTSTILSWIEDIFNIKLTED